MLKLLVVVLLFGAWAEAAIPINAFVKVEEGLYRGGQPDEIGMAYLKDIGVKTILDINNDDDEFESETAQASPMDLRYIPLSGFWEPSRKNMDQIESLIEDVTLRPLYIHCEHGKDRTGLAVALYRVHNGWSAQAAHDEWMALGHSRLLPLMDHYFWERVEK